jgi:hypothetical protein
MEMTDKTRKHMELAFARLVADLTANAEGTPDAVLFVKDLATNFKTFAKTNYTFQKNTAKALVDQQKAERAKAIADAKALKNQAKNALAAALAMKVNGRVAKKKNAEAVETPIVVTEA